MRSQSAGPSRRRRACAVAPAARGASRLVLALHAPLAVAATAGAARAQAPGVPVAPSAFIRPGIALAVNGGRSDGETAALVAAAYGSGAGRWQLMGGVGGTTTTDDGVRSPALAWGGRLGFRVWGRDQIGVVAFAGRGEARYRLDVPAGQESGTIVLRQQPFGVSAGYRGRWGAGGSGRAWGVSVAPAWVQQTLRVTDDASLDGSGVRATAMAEVALGRRLGVSLAYEDGRRAKGSEPGPRGAVWGVAVAVAR